MSIVLCIVAGILIYRVFSLQIVNGQTYLDDFQLKIEKERSLASARGNIYDKNGNLLAYNELAYSVTIEDVYEPYLMQIGFLTRTARGRCVTKLAYDHLGLKYKANAEQLTIDE